MEPTKDIILELAEKLVAVRVELKEFKEEVHTHLSKHGMGIEQLKQDAQPMRNLYFSVIKDVENLGKVDVSDLVGKPMFLYITKQVAAIYLGEPPSSIPSQHLYLLGHFGKLAQISARANLARAARSVLGPASKYNIAVATVPYAILELHEKLIYNQTKESSNDNQSSIT